MLLSSMPRRVRIPLVAVWLVVVCAVDCVPADGQDQDRLVDREPFDRIYLDASNDNKTLDVLPLSASGRAEAGDLPKSGDLEFRFVKAPTNRYTVPWQNVVEIRSFKDLLLEEGKRMSKAGQFDDAYDYFAYLKEHYPDSPGLAAASEDFLYRHASAAFEAKQYDDALSIISTLYDNNSKRAGLDRAVGQIAERLIQQQFDLKNFVTVRHFLRMMPSKFPSLELSTIERWKVRLQKLADQQLKEAARYFEKKDYDNARIRVHEAVTIRPGWAKAEALAAEVHKAWPQVVVAVDEAFRGNLTDRLDDWTSRRVRKLTRERLMELQGYGAEGGFYASPIGEAVPDAAGDRLTLLLGKSRQGDSGDWDAYALSRRLLATTRKTDPAAVDLAALLEAIDVEDDRTLHIEWAHPHVRPEALLQIELAGTPSQENGDPSPANANGPFRLATTKADESRFERRSHALPHAGESPIEIVERRFAREADAIEALEKGQIDIIERVSPWNRKRLAKIPNVVVASYALPTVHALLLNPDRPLLGRSEMRRAIAYGIDRPSILNRAVLAGEKFSGCSILSGPFPIGRELNAPIAYAYDRQVVQRNYSPHLAATLATVARQSLTGKSVKEGPPERPTPLILAHPPREFCRATCQMIAQYLAGSGIPTELVAAEATELAEQKIAWDLRYAEIAMWEPVIDAPRLLGPNGEADVRNAYLSLSLRRLDEAQNWPRVREHLHAVHRVVHNELVIIPLWQTVNTFAYRNNVINIGEEPVTLYDNVSSWRATPREIKR